MSEENQEKVVEAQAPVRDELQFVIDNARQTRVALMALRATKPADYDKALRETFPGNVLKLIENLAAELGTRVDLVAYNLDVLARGVVPSDEDEDEEMGEAEADAIRVLGEYVRGLAQDGVPPPVKSALAVLEAGGLFDDDDDGGAGEGSAGEKPAEERPAEETSAQEATDDAEDGKRQRDDATA